MLGERARVGLVGTQPTHSVDHGEFALVAIRTTSPPSDVYFRTQLTQVIECRLYSMLSPVTLNELSVELRRLWNVDA